MVRNFYGGLKVMDETADDSEEPVRRLMHGTITHGEQYPESRIRRAGPPLTTARTPASAAPSGRIRSAVPCASA